jgi:hypothetical protein
MLPKRVDDDKILEKVQMSDEQFNRYLEVRWDEIQMEAKKAMRGPGALNEDFTTARVLSRLACNYAVPGEMKPPKQRSEVEKVDKSEILARLVAEPDKYLRPAGLASYSPKLKRALELVTETLRKSDDFHNQFVYSAYRELEGLGVFGAILSANGFQAYKLTEEAGVFKEDPSMDPAKPAYAFYSGEEDVEKREISRYIFNEDWQGLGTSYPKHAQSIRESIVARGGKKLLCVLMGTAAAAEGLNLKNVRHIHIIEPHWNPARHDQVIGRGIRLCSHATRQKLDGTKDIVPVDDRTIRISFYVTVFSAAQLTTTNGFNIVPIQIGRAHV